MKGGWLVCVRACVCVFDHLGLWTFRNVCISCVYHKNEFQDINEIWNWTFFEISPPKKKKESKMEGSRVWMTWRYWMTQEELGAVEKLCSCHLVYFSSIQINSLTEPSPQGRVDMTADARRGEDKKGKCPQTLEERRERRRANSSSPFCTKDTIQTPEPGASPASETSWQDACLYTDSWWLW